MTPVRLEHTAPPSRVKHSTTEPLRSLFQMVNISVDKQKINQRRNYNLPYLENQPQKPVFRNNPEKSLALLKTA